VPHGQCMGQGPRGLWTSTDAITWYLWTLQAWSLVHPHSYSGRKKEGARHRLVRSLSHTTWVMTGQGGGTLESLFCLPPPPCWTESRKEDLSDVGDRVRSQPRGRGLIVPRVDPRGAQLAALPCPAPTPRLVSQPGSGLVAGAGSALMHYLFVFFWKNRTVCCGSGRLAERQAAERGSRLAKPPPRQDVYFQPLRQPRPTEAGQVEVTVWGVAPLPLTRPTGHQHWTQTQSLNKSAEASIQGWSMTGHTQGMVGSPRTGPALRRGLRPLPMTHSSLDCP
jgi:hypothetical protein